MSNVQTPLNLNALSATYRRLDRLACVAGGIEAEAALVLTQAREAPHVLAEHLSRADQRHLTAYADWLARIAQEAESWRLLLEEQGERLCAQVDLPGEVLADPIAARLTLGARLRTAATQPAIVDEEPPF